MTSREPSTTLRAAALAVAVLACLPYVALKVAWLAGSTVGALPGRGEELHQPRLVVANVVTLVLIALALLTAVGLARPWGRRLPAPALLVLGVGSSGLLVPIAVGLPLGVLVQEVLGRGSGLGGGHDLAGWVRPMVYGGFAALGASLCVLLALHAAARWPGIVRGGVPRPRGGALLAGAAAGLYGGAMVVWGLSGGGDLGAAPTPLQRTAEVVTGAIVLAGVAAPLVGGRRPGAAWAVTFVGCSTALMQALQGVALTARSHAVGVDVVTLVGALGGVVYGLTLLLAARSAAAQPSATDKRALSSGMAG